MLGKAWRAPILDGAPHQCCLTLRIPHTRWIHAGFMMHVATYVAQYRQTDSMWPCMQVSWNLDVHACIATCFNVYGGLYRSISIHKSAAATWQLMFDVLRLLYIAIPAVVATFFNIENFLLTKCHFVFVIMRECVYFFSSFANVWLNAQAWLNASHCAIKNRSCVRAMHFNSSRLICESLDFLPTCGSWCVVNRKRRWG
mgnify:CR=1 FL=1